MEKENKDNKNKKIKQLLSLPEYVVDMMRIKSSKSGLSLSEYVSDLILKDDNDRLAMEIDRKIRENEKNFRNQKIPIKNAQKILSKNIKRITDDYLKNKEILIKRKELLIKEVEIAGYNNENLRPIVLTLLKIYITRGRDGAIGYIGKFSIRYGISKDIIKRELNKAIGIYSNYTEEEVKEFKSTVMGIGPYQPKTFDELKECELPRGL